VIGPNSRRPQSGKHTEHNLRWVVLHHIEEVARHADIIRETIDGSTGQ
jgi:hypothetical protein